ncbi:MAG: integration host factor subunit beta [Bacteroidaceae bacterium]|jgi:DNA-binding protein HU-beta|nr:integration host factor subunit beta [Bacteroidaceae bacterium]MBQ8676187.1 integration host factor subunit beta [Bacteroidaceae bacterium]MBQ9175728.1 integration host factor subunit beta [Bacteroidaceae bacterium]MBR1379611.1 integration host factor subunit beta [Bacteroidaceae bacterium]
MTKADIVTKISEETGVDKDTVLTVVEAFMATVKNSLSSGKEVFLRGFGSFIIKTRKQKIARNISKNTSIVIPQHNIPAFKPAKSFAEQIK